MGLEGTHIEFKEDFADIALNMAALGGVAWMETLSLRAGVVDPRELDRLDPFFDSLGVWNAVRREVVVDVARCKRTNLGCSSIALIEVVAAHFCAKAVVQLGVHPLTKKQYVGWNAPEKRFTTERYALQPPHHYYDSLVREQQLFTQIFTYLHLLARNDADELNAFHRLSQGHCGLYALNYCGSPDAPLIDQLLVHDWQDEAKADRNGTVARARKVLGWLTRDVPLDKEDIDDWDRIDE